MNYGQVFETISDEPQEIHVLELLRTGAEVARNNARKHGLNAPPEENLVTTWFNLILGNGERAYEEPNASDPRREAVLRLAIAEARYHRALHKVDTHESEPNSAQQVANKLHAEVCLVLNGMPRRMRDGPADPFDLAFTEFGLKQLEKLLVEVGRERRLYKRYLSEARAERAKALRAWCAINRHENQNSRNELKLQSKGEYA